MSPPCVETLPAISIAPLSVWIFKSFLAATISCSPLLYIVMLPLVVSIVMSPFVTDISLVMLMSPSSVDIIND